MKTQEIHKETANLRIFQEIMKYLCNIILEVRVHSLLVFYPFFILRVPAYPNGAILLHDRIILNWHVILHRTIPKPYIHWKGMLLSRHYCRKKNNWPFQTILTRRQNCLLGGMLVALITWLYYGMPRYISVSCLQVQKTEAMLANGSYCPPF